MFNGKMKAVTFSYDDGVTQDIRLIEIFNKYSLKATFNINSGLLGNENSLVREGVAVSHIKNKACDAKYIYQGHEAAVHTLTHPFLPLLEKDEIIRQVEEDRIKLSEVFGYEIVGMAYPGGGENTNESVAETVKSNTGVKYARTTVSCYHFDIQNDLYRFNPTVYHHQEWDKMFKLADEFIQLETDTPKVFYIWGHSYEFDIRNEWDRFEEFCSMISGKEDIFYGTNKDVLLINR